MRRIRFNSDSWLVCLSVLIAAPVCFFYETLLLRTTKIQWDVLDIHYPALVYQSRMIQRGLLPLWDPHLFCGFPYIGHVQAAVYHPLHFLMSLVGEISPVRVQWLIILNVIICLLCTFIMLRTMRIGGLFCVMGAIVFSFSGQVLGHTTHLGILEGISILPLAIACVIRGFQHGKSVWFLFSGLILGIIAHAGHFQTAIYSLFTVLVYIVSEPWRSTVPAGTLRNRLVFRLSALLITVIAAAGTASIIIFPTLESALDSVRSSLSYSLASSESLSIQSIRTLFVPDYFGSVHGPYDGPWSRTNNLLYIGMLGLILLTVSLCFLKHRRVLFCWVFSVFGFLFALGNVTPVHFLVLKIIPGFALVRTPSAFLPIVWLHVGILVTICAQLLHDHADLRRVRRSLAGVSVVVPITIAWIAWEGISSGGIPKTRFIWPILMTSISICVLLLFLYVRPGGTRVSKSALGWGVIAVLLCDLFLTYRGTDMVFGRGQPYEDFRETEVHRLISTSYASDAFFRVHEWVSRTVILNNEGSVRNWYTTLGRISGIHLNRLGVLIRQAEYNRQILDLLRVRYVLVSQKKVAPRVVSTAGIDGPASTNPLESLIRHSDTVLENSKAFPVVFRAKDWQIADSFEKARELIPATDLSKTVILESDPGFEPSGENTGVIELMHYSEHTLAFSSSCSDQSIVVITDTIHSGWKASIDEEPTRIMTADLALRALVIPAGTHRVTLEFHPQSYKLGVFFTLLFISFAVMYLVCQFPYPNSTKS